MNLPLCLSSVDWDVSIIQQKSRRGLGRYINFVKSIRIYKWNLSHVCRPMPPKSQWASTYTVRRVRTSDKRFFPSNLAHCKSNKVTQTPNTPHTHVRNRVSSRTTLYLNKVQSTRAAPTCSTHAKCQWVTLILLMEICTCVCSKICHDGIQCMLCVGAVFFI